MSLFRPFPTTRGPVKMLVYGDPGTEKTRRALRMPGPLYVIDLENGSADYGDIVDTKRDKYLATKSHVTVLEALREIGRLPPEQVGTVILDPITVVWQSIQNAHTERVMTKGYKDKGRLVKPEHPEEVPFDVGVWGKLKRTYGDILSTLIASHYHVVMIARGKEKTNERGDKVGYGYEGEKSTEFLAKIVLVSHADGDVVLKDRTGTFKEGGRQPRIDFRRFLENATRTAQHIQTESEAAAQDATEGGAAAATNGHHPSWDVDRVKFSAALREHLKLKYDDVAAWCESQGMARPSHMDVEGRQALWLRLRDEGGADEVRVWLKERASVQGEGQPAAEAK